MKSQHKHCTTCGKIMPNIDQFDEETQRKIREAAELANTGGGEIDE